MHKIFSIFFMVLLLAYPINVFSQERHQVNYAPGEVLVKFRSGVTSQLAEATHRFFGARAIKRFRHFNLDRIKIPKDWSVQETIYWYRFDPDVEYAEPNYIRRISLTPNDPNFDILWGLHNTGQLVNGTSGTSDADINAPEAWETETGSSSFVIAVLDTGADWNHEDLSNNIWSNADEIPNNGIDDDNNGYIDDVRGWDFVPFNGDNDPSDDNDPVYHGTHVSGTIAAEGNNGIGITGVCWTASIMPLKILDESGLGFVSDIVEAIDYAVANGAKVINVSLSGTFFSTPEYEAIERARDNGVLVVAAAGNSGDGFQSFGWNNDILLQANYPASYDLENIIAVAATNQNDLLASFSNYGPVSVDVAAPGVNIYSTRAGNGYQYLGGTSMATPHVSGLAALIWSANSGLTYTQVKDKILNSVDVKPGLTGKILTWGRVNARNSFLPYPPTNLAVTPVSINQINLSWTDNSADETGFRIERKTGSGGTYTQIATVNANVTSYSNTGLDEATTYFYRVAAYNQRGNSGYTNEANTATFPAAPSNLSATGISISEIDLSWTDNSSGEQGFLIESRLDTASTYSQIATVNANVTEFRNNDLYAGILYHFRVRAYTSGGNSSYSNEASAVALPPSTNGGDSRCFIATAVYGAEDHHHVRILRGFRDMYLLGNPAGSTFVDLYYRYSPSLANVIEHNQGLRTVVRFGLMPIISVCTFILYGGPVEKTVLFVFALVLASSLCYRRFLRKNRFGE
jgi:subtilisin family serine protease